MFLESVKVIQSKEFEQSNFAIITIPSSVEIIGNGAFSYGKYPTTIDIDNPSSVNRIEILALYGCL